MQKCVDSCSTECTRIFLQLLLEALSIMNALTHMHDDNTKEYDNQWTDSHMTHFITQDIH